MQYKFIPVDNNLDKAEAFANTLNNSNIRNVQKIIQPESYIKTLDVIERFQNEGWLLKGVSEQRGKSNRKVTHNFAQLHHPDFDIKTKVGGIDSVASITISNSCNGKSPIELNLGAFRMVCSNGMISRSTLTESKINHTSEGYRDLPSIINGFHLSSRALATNIEKLQNTELTSKEISNFAFDAVRAKYGSGIPQDYDFNKVVRANRKEDEGNNVWVVFNRLQESLTQNVSRMSDDIRLNKDLFSLAEAYA
tara:strand:+ start:820 stop:1572 length:753 start_codon:yes stop_codon:yes gene_type:complete